MRLQHQCMVSLAGTCLAAMEVVPGATWTSPSTGQHIQAHAPGIIQSSGVYYMVGEDKTNGSSFQNVNCYSSKDLVEWKFEKALLSETANGGDLGPNRIVERPKVIYNANTKKYVMYMHIDDSNYAEAKVGVATSDSVCGGYDYHGSFQPLGHQSRDMGLFQDTNGSAYLISEDRPNGLHIYSLSDDYLNVTADVHLWPDHLESPAILKTNDYYFAFGSHLTGWSTNDNVYSYATSLSGPWSSWTTFAAVGSNTYNSQTSFILPVGGSAFYLGDRWVSTNLHASTYIWLPLEISGLTITMQNQDAWVPNVQSGTWAAAPSKKQYEGETATLSNGSRVVSCSGCSGGSAAGWVGGPSDGTVSFSNAEAPDAQRSTVTIVYANGDSQSRYATVEVNGKSQNVEFLPSPSGQQTASSVVICDLVKGAANTITIKGLNGGYGPDIDVIYVPQ